MKQPDSDGRCSYCQASVLWVKNRRTGNWQVIDAEPCERGNVVVYRNTSSGELTCDVFGRNLKVVQLILDPEVRFRLDHHITCPNYSPKK